MLKFQEMQVDTEPFPINIINFDGKKILIRPSAANKGKDKEVLIGAAREADEITKNSCRKVVTERTPDGRETLKVTITTSNAGGRRRQVIGHGAPVLHIADGPTHKRGRSGTSSDSLGHSSGRSGNDQEPRRRRTFKPR
jgi:hypothetical protein